MATASNVIFILSHLDIITCTLVQTNFCLSAYDTDNCNSLLSPANEVVFKDFIFLGLWCAVVW